MDFLKDLSFKKSCRPAQLHKNPKKPFSHPDPQLAAPSIGKLEDQTPLIAATPSRTSIQITKAKHRSRSYLNCAARNGANMLGNELMNGEA